RPKEPRRARGRAVAAGAAERGGRSEREHDAVYHRCGKSVRDRGRGQRRAARRVRDLPGASAILVIAPLGSDPSTPQKSWTFASFIVHNLPSFNQEDLPCVSVLRSVSVA